MLLHGLPADAEASDPGPDDKPSQHRRAAATVGAALEALLPAVDANDDGKLRVAVAFFNSVFCSVVALRSDDPGSAGNGAGAGLAVGIDLRYWAVELVERLAEVARTLQPHEGASGAAEEGCVESRFPPTPFRARMCTERGCRWMNAVQGRRRDGSLVAWAALHLHAFHSSALPEAAGRSRACRV